MAMKILHFIPRVPRQAEQAPFIDLFLEKMAETAEVHLAQLAPVATTPRPYTQHCIGTGAASYGQRWPVCRSALKRRYLTLLYDLMPQIVHIHGCYNRLSAQVLAWSVERGFCVVFSPYGGMNPHYIDAEYGPRMWKMVAYQQAMTRAASCLVVSDREEEAYLQNEKLAQRIAFVDDPRDGDFMDLDGYTSSIIAVYQKALDTDKGKHLGKNCHEATAALLHLSMAGEQERKPLCAEDILNLRSITPRQWRDIMIFASEQGIGRHVANGIERAQLKVSAIDIRQIEQFAPRYPKDLRPLEGERLLTGNWVVKRRLKRLDAAEPTARKLSIMLWNLQHHLSKHTLCLRHLCDLYEVLRFETVDEDQLATLLADVGLLRFTRRVCQVLAESIYLEPGFMPVPALDDGGTAHLRTNLIKY